MLSFFLLFERTFLCVFKGRSIKSWQLNSKGVSALGFSKHRRAFCLEWEENIFGTVKKCPLNQQLRRFFEDKYQTSAVNFPTSALVKWDVQQWGFGSLMQCLAERPPPPKKNIYIYLNYFWTTFDIPFLSFQWTSHFCIFKRQIFRGHGPVSTG
jgi:hypothetical protein